MFPTSQIIGTLPESNIILNSFKYIGNNICDVFVYDIVVMTCFVIFKICFFIPLKFFDSEISQLIFILMVSLVSATLWYSALSISSPLFKSLKQSNKFSIVAPGCRLPFLVFVIFQYSFLLFS